MCVHLTGCALRVCVHVYERICACYKGVCLCVFVCPCTCVPLRVRVCVHACVRTCVYPHPLSQGDRFAQLHQGQGMI